MRNILFIKVKPLDKPGWNTGVAQPLGLMYLASAIRKEFDRKYNIKIVDMKLHNMPLERLRKIISEFSPDIVGCSVCSDEDKCMHEVARITKEFNKDCKVIVGGPHATSYYAEILEDSNIDVAVIGEGERTLIELFRAFEDEIDISKIPGMAFRDDSRIVFTGFSEFIDNLDSLSFPSWDLIDINAYSRKNIFLMNTMLAGRKYMGIFTSRGCPYGCIYCHNIFGKGFRKRSPENVFREIKELHDRYDVDEIHIFDDIFNLDIQRAKKICDLIINSGIKIKLAFPNALRGDIVDKDLILKLKKAGAYAITYALETASPRLQKLIDKNIDIKRLKEAINFSSELGLLTKCYFMIGFPTETEEEVFQTIKFACSSRLLLASFFIVTVQKATRLFNMTRELYQDFNLDFNRSDYYIANKNYEKFFTFSLSKLQKLAYRRFFLDIRRLIKLFILTPRKYYLIKSVPIFFRRNIFWFRRRI